MDSRCGSTTSGAILITSGSLKKMIDEDGLRGMTSNPAIFEKAIGESWLYDDMLKSLASSRNDLDTTVEQFDSRRHSGRRQIASFNCICES